MQWLSGIDMITKAERHLLGVYSYRNSKTDSMSSSESLCFYLGYHSSWQRWYECSYWQWITKEKVLSKKSVSYNGLEILNKAVILIHSVRGHGLCKQIRFSSSGPSELSVYGEKTCSFSWAKCFILLSNSIGD